MSTTTTEWSGVEEKMFRCGSLCWGVGAEACSTPCSPPPCPHSSSALSPCCSHPAVLCFSQAAVMNGAFQRLPAPVKHRLA
ncbi:hypothetical protein SKAU_G00375130 [Synaphobranchus kaupii]|uniref:Uncharacterized protein n=1 Tax=Synaphobranchus kaupii TaxID=118154 RepID=A0A9Q1EGU5_SYNKA|nr:hypothetical protein SKAU_G00375130 [Synaphobranchus kaupii]